MEKIKPCPFCGGVPKVYDWERGYEYGTIIECASCGACISEGVEDGNGWHDRAIEKWNRRVNDINERTK